MQKLYVPPGKANLSGELSLRMPGERGCEDTAEVEETADGFGG